MLPEGEGGNINGPSLIRTPEWLPGRLGAYYLYFAHHAGRHIRLAFANSLDGPWSIHAPGTLRLEDAPGCRDHIASPDVHVDEASRQIVMYFHGPEAGGRRQRSFVARSADGLRFAAEAAPIADFYLRMVPWRDGWVGMSKGGVLYTRRQGGRLRRRWRPAFPMSGRWANGVGDVRHVALRCRGDRLTVYFTRIGDAPERILEAEIDLARPAWRWSARGRHEILRPEMAWEGAGLPASASRSGAAKGPENAVRDPAIHEENGRIWLFYAVAGESGIAIAELS